MSAYRVRAPEELVAEGVISADALAKVRRQIAEEGGGQTEPDQASVAGGDFAEVRQVQNFQGGGHPELHDPSVCGEARCEKQSREDGA